MLSLVPDPPVPELLEFCQNENIKNIHFHVRKVKDNVPLNYNKVVQLIQVNFLKFQLTYTYIYIY